MWKSILKWFRPDVVTPTVNIESELLYSHNKLRNAFGLEDLVIDDKLTEAAKSHAAWMADKRRLSHSGRGGSTPQQRARIAGVDAMYISENIAMCNCSVQNVMELWYDSKGHRENILSKVTKKAGFAKSGSYWCVIFSN